MGALRAPLPFGSLMRSLLLPLGRAAPSGIPVAARLMRVYHREQSCRQRARGAVGQARGARGARAPATPLARYARLHRPPDLRAASALLPRSTFVTGVNRWCADPCMLRVASCELRVASCAVCFTTRWFGRHLERYVGSDGAW